MFRQHIIRIGLIIISFMLYSCNFYKIRENQLNTKFNGAGLESHYYKSKDATIHYWTGGNGTPLVLIHGFGADSRFQWYDQVKEFSKKYTLIIPDLIYFSESVSSSNDFSVDYQAKKIIELINHLKINRFLLGGVSYGGLVAITVCDRIPDRVDKLVLSDSPIKYYTIKHNEKALQKFNATTIQDLLIPKRPEDVPRLMELAYYDPPWIPGMVLKNIHQNMFLNQADEKGRLLEYLKVNEKKFNAKDYRVNCNVLLIWGRHDMLIPTEIGEKLKEYFKDKARLVIIEKTSHMPNLEKARDFNKMVMEFLGE